MSGPGDPSATDDERLRRAIESTVLGSGVAGEAVDDLCRDAVARGLGAVCVPPAWIERAADGVAGTGVRVVSVANFPFGHGLPAAVEAEARAALEAGADGVDLVFPLHCVPERDWRAARAVLDAFRRGIGDVDWRVILETAAWTAEELDDLLSFVRSRSVPAVKTSTGFHPAGGAAIEDVRTLRRALPEAAGIKAAGGIRGRRFALELLDAGADHLGTSSARALLEA